MIAYKSLSLLNTPKLLLTSPMGRKLTTLDT